MKLILTAFAVLLCSAVYNQTTIKPEDVNKHIGDSVTVCGKVFSARYMENVKNSPTFLNIGAPYPNQLLTVVIWGDTRKQFEGKPEDMYNGKEICISGKVELYKNKPQLVIWKILQIKYR